MAASVVSPIGQVVLLGGIFFCVFIAYYMLQDFAPTLYGEEVGGDMEAVLYTCFTVACVFAPRVADSLGCRTTLFVGALGYATLAASSLVLAALGEQRGACQRWLIIGSGACVGVGAALLWTAQGTLMLVHGGPHGTGRAFAIFWGMFNASAIAGGVLTAAFFSAQRQTWMLYAVFLGTTVAGATGAWALSPLPSEPAAAARAHEAQPRAWRLACSACARDVRATLRELRTPRGLRLLPLWLFSGAGQPYQLDTFGDRLLGSGALGLALAVFYTAEVGGGALAAVVLDGAGPAAARGPARPSQPAVALLGACAATLAASAVAAWLELRALRAGEAAHPPQVRSLALWPGGVACAGAYALWGCADALIQAWCYWEMSAWPSSRCCGAAECAVDARAQPMLPACPDEWADAGAPAAAASMAPAPTIAPLLLSAGVTTHDAATAEPATDPPLPAAAEGGPQYGQRPPHAPAAEEPATGDATRLLVASTAAHASELGRRVGCYKMMQSLGWAIGFVLSPPTRCAPLTQLAGVVALALVGTVGALMHLRRHRPTAQTALQQ